MKFDKKSSKFGLHESLTIPIAARTLDAIREYVGEFEVFKSGSKEAYIVNFEPWATPNEMEIWSNPRSHLLHASKQVWVHVDNKSYRRLYKNIFPGLELKGFDVDHIFSRQLAKMYGFEYVRLLHVLEKYNRITGSGPEKDSTVFRKTQYHPVKYEIQYADPLDISKLLHMEIGTGEYLQVSANFHLFYGNDTITKK
jgi:hypothetical protein